MNELPISPCVRSGYCCKKSACWAGQMGRDGCIHLVGPKPGQYKCAIAHWIKKQRGAEVSPAFGAGCCSPLNTTRREVVNGLHKGG